jgi:transposase
MTRRAYTDADLSIIEKMVKNGISVSEIAAHLGRPVESVRTRARAYREKDICDTSIERNNLAFTRDMARLGVHFGG